MFEALAVQLIFLALFIYAGCKGWGLPGKRAKANGKPDRSTG